MTEFVKLEGFAELDKSLRQFPILLQEDVLKKAMVQGARVFQKAAQEKAPVGTVQHRDKKGRMEQPGTGRASIRVRKLQQSADASVRYAVGIYKKGWYMKLIETGWIPTGPKKKDNTYGKHRFLAAQKNKPVPGRPFLEPAYQSKTNEALSVIKQTISKWIVKYKTPRKRKRSA